MAFTGDQFVGITDKRILGYEDFGTYFLDHLRWAIEMVLSKVYTKNGTFGSTKIGLGSVSNDTFRLLADGEGVSSEGHLFEYQDSLTDYAFENQNGQTYEVGFHYSEHPVALAINPRTGQPEFTRYEEHCGGEATGAGGLIIDNGSNLTINVNGCVEAGVDNSGRQVRVWKNVPGPNATSMSVAVETRTVQWGDLGYGNVNYVVTSAKFGQDTVDTWPGSYSCQLIGPYVSRGSSIKTNGYWFIGEITGNGPSATPTVFDLTDQNLIPFSLSESQDAANITVDDSNFHPDQMGDSDSGGIGSPYSILQDVLDAIDEGMVRGRTSITLSDGTSRSIADYVGATVLSTVNTLGHGGTYLVKDGGAIALAAGVSALGGASNLPKIVGDVKTGGHQGYTPLIFQDGGSVNTKLRGTFERLQFYSADSGNAWEVPLGVDYGDTHFHDCGFLSGNLRIIGNDSDEKAIVFSDCEFAAGSSDGAFQQVLTAQRLSLGYWPHVIFDRCVFRGPHSSASGAWGVLHLDDFGYALDQISEIRSRAFVFKDCRFIHEEINGMPTIWVGDCFPQEVFFERCIVKGKSGMTQPLVYAENSKVHFRDCLFDAPSGEAFLLDGCDGSMEDCFVITGDDTTSIADPQMISISSYTNEGFSIRNLKCSVGESSCRSTGTEYMIELGGTLGVKKVDSSITLDGLFVKTQPSVDLHKGGTLMMRSSDGAASTYRNITLDGDNSAYFTPSEPHVFIEGDYPISDGANLFVENITLVNFPPFLTNLYEDFIRISYGFVKNIRVHLKGVATAVGYFQSIVHIDDQSHVDGIYLDADWVTGYPPFSSNSDGLVYVSASNCVIRNVDMSNAPCTGYTESAFYLVGCSNNLVENVFLPQGTNYNVAMKGVYLSNCSQSVFKSIRANIDSGTEMDDYIIYLINSSGNNSFTGCLIVAPQDTGSYKFISLNQVGCLVMANIFESNNANPASVTIVGTGTIGDSTNNVIR